MIRQRVPAFSVAKSLLKLTACVSISAKEIDQISAKQID